MAASTRLVVLKLSHNSEQVVNQKHDAIDTAETISEQNIRAMNKFDGKFFKNTNNIFFLREIDKIQ